MPEQETWTHRSPSGAVYVWLGLGSWVLGRLGGKHGGNVHTPGGARGQWKRKQGKIYCIMIPLPLGLHLPQAASAPPWTHGLCAHRHGRTCSAGSTRYLDAGARAVQPPPDRTGGKDHSRLGKRPTRRDKEMMNRMRLDSQGTSPG